MLPALADEKKRVVEDVAKDRQHAIDAAIVRTMKSRKVMNHQQVQASKTDERSTLRSQAVRRAAGTALQTEERCCMEPGSASRANCSCAPARGQQCAANGWTMPAA